MVGFLVEGHIYGFSHKKILWLSWNSLVWFNRCLSDVGERIESLKQADEPDDGQYEDHTLFKQEHDEQLLQWTQRYTPNLCV